MVFYRKYRPQTISELDLTAIRNKLSSILARDEVPHAFLFTGPKGLGKTSAARIVAKAINCERKSKIPPASQARALRAGKNQKSKIQVKSKKARDQELKTNDQFEPCNECDACISITNGSNIDVIEIDAASNRGIDEIRDLREKIKFSPTNLAKKVYIIDEVHMLTTEAFNALLKTLEEPPSHAVFVLATTEAWRLPPTIVSRTFHVQFEKPSPEEIFRSLKRVIDGERLELENGILEKVAELSDGAFRDGAKILEELSLSAKDKKITLKLLDEMFKTGSIETEVKKLLTTLAARDAKESLAVLDRLAENGCDFKVVTEKIVERLRSMLLARSGLPSDVSSDELEQLEIRNLKTLLEYFNEAYKNIKTSVLPQLPLELAVVKFCFAEPNNEIGIMNQENDDASLKPAKNNLQQKPNVEVNVVSVENIAQPNLHPGMVKSDDFLKSLIEKVKKDNFSVAGVLRSVKVLKITDDDVTIATPYKFHGEKLADLKVQKLLEGKASEILGKSVKIIVTINEKN